MLLGVPLSELFWLALAIIIAGVITGLLAGLFGIGGGTVIVPVLYEAFRLLGVPDEVRMQLCIGTSIAIIVPTAIRSYLTHREKGLVVPGVIQVWAVPAVLGVVCGAIIAALAPEQLAAGVFARFRFGVIPQTAQDQAHRAVFLGQVPRPELSAGKIKGREVSGAEQDEDPAAIRHR